MPLSISRILFRLPPLTLGLGLLTTSEFLRMLDREFTRAAVPVDARPRRHEVPMVHDIRLGRANGCRLMFAARQ